MEQFQLQRGVGGEGENMNKNKETRGQKHKFIRLIFILGPSSSLSHSTQQPNEQRRATSERRRRTGRAMKAKPGEEGKADNYGGAED